MQRYSFGRRDLEIFNVDLGFNSSHRRRATKGFTSPISELTALHIQCMVISAKLTMLSTHLRRYRNAYHPIGISTDPRTESHVLAELGNEGAHEQYKRRPVSSTQNIVAHITLLGQGPLHIEKSWERATQYISTNNLFTRSTTQHFGVFCCLHDL